MIARFRLVGEPVPKARPRLGRGGNTYTPRETLEAENVLGWTFKASNPGWRPRRDREYDVDLVFYVGKNRGKPDLDNLTKTVLDGLNKVAWEDDAQVARITACVVRGAEQPMTIVKINEIAPDRVTPKP